MTDLTTSAHETGNARNPDRSLTDTSDMFLPHSVFRREFALASRVVRRIPVGDRDRAAYAADHLGFLLDTLTHHHENEDELLWPRLRDRAPADVAPILDVMEGHHRTIHERLERLAEHLAVWAADPSEANREVLAESFDAAYAILDEHLAAEETQILPIAARTVSQVEWDEMGARGMAAIPKERQMLALGSMHYSAPPAIFEKVKADLPRLMRPILLRLADRAFRKVAVQLHGTSTP